MTYNVFGETLNVTQPNCLSLSVKQWQVVMLSVWYGHQLHTKWNGVEYCHGHCYSFCSCEIVKEKSCSLLICSFWQAFAWVAKPLSCTFPVCNEWLSQVTTTCLRAFSHSSGSRKKQRERSWRESWERRCRQIRYGSWKYNIHDSESGWCSDMPFTSLTLLSGCCKGHQTYENSIPLRSKCLLFCDGHS